MELATINKRIAMLENQENELAKAKEMIKNELENSEEYQRACAQMKEALSAKKMAMAAILGDETYQKLLAEIKDINEEIKTLKEILNTELIEHFKKTNSDQIIDNSGQVRRFKINVRLLPKKNIFQQDF